MGLQLAEYSRPLSRPIAQDARHRQLRIVVQDRLRYAAEEAERGIVPVTKRFGGLRRIGLHKAGVAVRQVDCKEVDLALYPGDLRQRLTKVRLRMARIVPQRYEDLPLSQPARQHVILNNGDPAGIAVLVAKPLEDPLSSKSCCLPGKLTGRQHDFVDEFFANQQNGAAAYRKAYKSKMSSGTCSAKAQQLLAHPAV